MRACSAVCLLLCLAATVRAEVLIRWDQDQVPSPESLGITTLVVPAVNSAAVESARAQGYRIVVELEAARLGTFVPRGQLAGVVIRGRASAAQLRVLRQHLSSNGGRVLEVEERGKWPHIRSNWVTKNKEEVLQVTGRSAQPWIENNSALFRIVRSARPNVVPLVTYGWQPVTISDRDDGPSLDDYLVAIAEAGSFGADLLLPLHARFQKNLLLGEPRARADWQEIRRYVQFYSWTRPERYQPIANIGVVTGDPMASFEVMNLLARHNLPFQVVAPGKLAELPAGLKLLIVPDEPTDAQMRDVGAFAARGGLVVLASGDGKLAARGPWRDSAPILKTAERVTYRVGDGQVVRKLAPIADPNAFALEVRQLLGREHRVIDIWNGITVLAAPYEAADGSMVLVTALNYAHQPLPVQVRVPGTFAVVRYESPEEPAALLPLEHRDGRTEFLLPALRIGARVFLSRVP